MKMNYSGVSDKIGLNNYNNLNMALYGKSYLFS